MIDSVSTQESGLENYGTSSFGGDLAPMLDVVFMLLVFFLLTIGASFPSIELELPKGQSEVTAQPDKNQLVVEVTKNGYRLDSREFTEIMELESYLEKRKKTNRGLTVFIAGEKETPLQPVISLLTALQRKEIQTANILMEEK